MSLLTADYFAPGGRWLKWLKLPPTLRYLLWRILGALLVLVVGSFLVFVTMKAAPGDPALAALGEQAPPEAIAAFRLKNGLDRPLIVQFSTWLGHMAEGDFGRSIVVASGRPISELLRVRLPATIFVGLYALTIAILASLVLGTIAAVRRGRTADMVATSIAVLGISMPDFFLSYMLILGLALALGLFPSYGFVSPADSLIGALHASFLPALAIAAPMAAVFARTLRAALLEVIRRPYVTIIGLQVRYVLGGVVVIERIFGIPGIGSLMVDAAFGRDYPLVQACMVTFLAIVLMVNLLVDIACTGLDPRRSR